MSYTGSARLTASLSCIAGLVVVLTVAASQTTVALGLVGALVLACAAYLVWTSPPHYTLTLAIMLAPFSGNWQQLGLPGPAAPDRLLVLGGILTVLLRGPAIRHRPPLRVEAAHWALALAALYATGSALASHTLFNNATGLKLVETFGFFPFLIFAIAPVVFPTARERAVLLTGLVALGVYLSLTTLFEFTGPKGLVLPPYIDNFAYGIHGGRGRGPFADAVANGFGLYTCGLACVIAIWTWTGRGWRLFAGVVGLLCLVGCMLTVERSVWLATVTGSLVALLATRTTRRWVVPAILGGALLAGVGLLVIPEASSKVTKQAANQYSVWDRENLANTAYNMINARPLFGFGWQTYEEKHLPYEQQLPDIPLTASTAGLHNIVLSYAVDLGLVGAGLWLLGLLLGVGGALIARAPPDLQPWRLALLALFVFFVVQENSVPPTVFQNLGLWLWAGVVWSARYRAPIFRMSPASGPSHMSPAQDAKFRTTLDLRDPAITTVCDLVNSAAEASWRGPDPYDGLLHPWPRVLRGGRRRRQAIVQLHARAPFDIRPLYGRREQPRIAKALALFGQAVVRLETSVDEVTRARGLEALSLLSDDRSAGDAWGYPFDVQTRWSFYPAGAPNVVVTSFAADALGEAGRRLGNEHYAERAKDAARWTLEHSFNERTGAFSYHEHSDAVIHNANLLAARLVWRELGDDSAARDAVRRAVERTLSAQAPDGLWEYGIGPGLEWSDSFHTGFVLGALADLLEADSSVPNALAWGAPTYAERFFGPRGEAWLWPDRPHPEDAHAAGTGLSTLAALTRLELVDHSLLARVAGRVVSSTVRDGHAVWRRDRWLTTTIPYLRWCDAHVALGLADAAGIGAV